MPDERSRALAAKRKGISLSPKPVAPPIGVLAHAGSKAGRPRSNVFDDYQRRKDPKSKQKTDIALQRVMLLGRHQASRNIFRDAPDAAMHGPTGWRLYPSVTYRQQGNPIWTVYRAAELAWILMGHATPENQHKRPKGLWKEDTFVIETYGFWSFLCDHIEMNRHKHPGRPPSAEKLFKTALAAFVARKLVSPNGGNWRVTPTPRHVSQIWFVLFGENEHHDTLRKRLPAVGWYCQRFPEEYLNLCVRLHCAYARIRLT